MRDKMFSLKRYAGRGLGILAILGATAAVPLAVGSGTPAGASEGYGYCCDGLLVPVGNALHHHFICLDEGEF